MKNKQTSNGLSWQPWFVTVGGVGNLPLAPGTWGAMVGVLLLLPFLGLSGTVFMPYLATAIVIFTYLGAKAACDLEPSWGEDPSRIVIDEVVGVWVALLGHQLGWTEIIGGFVLFRIFDIWKPFGIRQLERFNKGWGVMLDDVGAGIVANICLWLILFLFQNL